MTLIASYDSEGRCLARCDANCHNATKPICTCVCGGMNHGVGIKKAMANTREYAEEMIKEYSEANGPGLSFKVAPEAAQLTIF